MFPTRQSLGLAIAAIVALSGCGKEKPQATETFHWCPQPVSFSPPPPSHWQRQGDNGGGTLGVRFILTGGGGQCISVAAFTSFAERDRRSTITRLIADGHA